MADEKTIEYYRQHIVPKYTKLIEDELFIYESYRLMKNRNIDGNKALKFWGTQQSYTRSEITKLNKEMSKITDNKLLNKFKLRKSNLKVKEKFIENQIKQLLNDQNKIKKGNKSIQE